MKKSLIFPLQKEAYSFSNSHRGGVLGRALRKLVINDLKSWNKNMVRHIILSFHLQKSKTFSPEILDPKLKQGATGVMCNRHRFVLLSYFNTKTYQLKCTKKIQQGRHTLNSTPPSDLYLTYAHSPTTQAFTGLDSCFGEDGIDVLLNGAFCRYRKAKCFWELWIGLYLELFCFLAFVSFVLRNLCSSTRGASPVLQ